MSSRSPLVTLVAWSAVLLLAWCARTPRDPRPTEAPAHGSSVVEPLGHGPPASPLRPFAHLAGGLAWLRADVAWRAGHVELAFARAESALALDPGATSGWAQLARWHVTLASPAVEPDLELRGAWLAAGLAVLARGEESARDPAQLAFDAALALILQASFDEPPAWPGGTAAMHAQAQRQLERAAAAGHTFARELLED